MNLIKLLNNNEIKSLNNNRCPPEYRYYNISETILKILLQKNTIPKD